MPGSRIIPIETSYWVDGKLVSRTSSTTAAPRDVPASTRSATRPTSTQPVYRDSRSSPTSSQVHKTVYDISKGRAIPIEDTYVRKPKISSLEPRSSTTRPKEYGSSAGSGDRYIRVEVPRDTAARSGTASANYPASRTRATDHDRTPAIRSADSDLDRPRIRIERERSPLPRDVKQTTSSRNNLTVDNGSMRSNSARQSVRSSSRDFRDESGYSSYDDRQSTGRDHRSFKSASVRSSGTGDYTSREPLRKEKMRYADDLPDEPVDRTQRYYLDDDYDRRYESDRRLPSESYSVRDDPPRRGHTKDDLDDRYEHSTTRDSYDSRNDERHRDRRYESDRDTYDSRNDGRPHNGQSYESNRGYRDSRHDDSPRDSRRDDSDREYSYDRRDERQRDTKRDESDHDYRRDESDRDHAGYSSRESRRPQKDGRGRDNARDRSSDRDLPRSTEKQPERSKDRSRSRSKSRDRKKEKSNRNSGGLASLLPAVMNLGATAALGGGMTAALSGGEELLKKFLNKDKHDEESDDDHNRSSREDQSHDETVREKDTNRRDRRSGRESDKDASDRERDSSRRRHKRDRAYSHEQDRSDREGHESDRTRDSASRSHNRERDHRPAYRHDRDGSEHVLDESDDASHADNSTVLGPDEDYRRRLQEAQQASAQNLPFVNSSASRPAEGESASSRPRAASFSPNSPLPSPSFGGRQVSLVDESVTYSPSDVSSSVQTDDTIKPKTRVRIIEPSEEKTKEREIKGILKQPKDKFPEYPNPVREGVAPLNNHRVSSSGKTSGRVVH